jgi:16S rRNA processing protein RimM
MMIAVGQIARPHGLKGMVRVTPLTDTPGRFRALSQVVAEKADGTLVTLTVESVAGHETAPLLKFHGVDSPEQADGLRDAYLLVPREEIPPLPEGTYYVFDLIGYDVLTEDGQPVGTLSDVLQLPANDAFVVRLHPGRFSGSSPRSGEVLIPAVREFLRIDPERKKIIVRGVEELLE